MATIAEQLTSLANTKTAIKDAIVAKGVMVEDDTPFSGYAAKIGEIQSGGGVPVTKFGLSIDDLLGNVDVNGNYVFPNGGGKFDGTGIKNITQYAFYYKFHKGNITEFHMPDLESVGSYGLGYVCSGDENLIVVDMPNIKTFDTFCMQHAFYGTGVISENVFINQTEISGSFTFSNIFSRTKLTTTSLHNVVKCSGSYTLNGGYSACDELLETGLENLEEINGSSVLASTFQACKKLTTTGLVKLKKVSGSSACSNMFNGCIGLTKEYFYELVEVNTANALDTMFSGCGGITEIHFRADAQAVIEGLIGYDKKFGATNAQIIFDL